MHVGAHLYMRERESKNVRTISLNRKQYNIKSTWDFQTKWQLIGYSKQQEIGTENKLKNEDKLMHWNIFKWYINEMCT